MKYVRLTLPLLIALVALLLAEFGLSENQPLLAIARIAIKAALFIWCLRESGAGKPFQSQLTILLLVVFVGEFFFGYVRPLGQVLYGFGSLGFAALYFARQKMQRKTDMLTGLKVASVCVFALVNVVIAVDPYLSTLAVLGNFALGASYIYTRFMEVT